MLHPIGNPDTPESVQGYIHGLSESVLAFCCAPRTDSASEGQAPCTLGIPSIFPPIPDYIRGPTRV
jgi:hypothetical protein